MFARRAAAIMLAVGAVTGIASPAFAGAAPGASLEVTAPPAPCTTVYYKGNVIHPKELRLSCDGELIRLYASLDGKFYPTADDTAVTAPSIRNIRIQEAILINGEARVWYANYATLDDQGYPAAYAAIRNLHKPPAATNVVPTLG